MRKIKLFEDFKNDEFIGSEVLNILRPLGKFYFKYDVRFDSGRLVISLSKKDTEGIRVFDSSDVLETLLNVDGYLSMGESMTLETIFVKTISVEKELKLVKEISRENGLLSIVLVYN